MNRALLIVVRHWWVLRSGRPWGLAVNGVFEPFLYLMSIGVGIGQLVGDVVGDGGQASRYAAFVAPALLATSAMNSAVNETTGEIFFRLRFSKAYDAIVTTPMSAADIALGEVIAAMLRGCVAATCFFGVIAALGLIHSWWSLFIVPATLLIAFGFAGAGLAVTTFMSQLHHNQWVQLFMLPMFLFATTFYPLSVYPQPVRWLVVALPLYHSTELLRALALGTVSSGSLIALVYLAALGAAGLAVASRRLGRLLTA
jgi:lipooligosaccharide transport system permease protein